MANSVMEKLKKTYQGKKILVVGLGLQGGGVGVARFFAEIGAKVTVTDKKSEKQLLLSINRLSDLPITFHLGGHNIRDFLETDLIIKGPSVPWDLPEIIEAEKRKIPIEMEMSFFATHCPAKIIGVTGTRGKSTTTHLIFNLLKKSGFSVYLAGGISGISTINYLKTLTKNNWVVMELSSWALSGFHRKKISPHIAVFTNFYPDHLNYYKNMTDYLYDKKAIYLYQKKDDFLVAGFNLAEIIKKDFVKSRVTFVQSADFPENSLYLKGEHNRENAAFALAVAKILGIDEQKAVRIISSTKGLPYRQQIIGQKDNIVFVNDTTSTTPIAALKAIKFFRQEKIILFLGGNSKNLPTKELIDELKNVEKIVLLAGSFTEEILPELKKRYFDKLIGLYDNLEKALTNAYKTAQLLNRHSYPKEKKKIILLFSPAATSFAMFNNEFHRGDEFNRLVNNILNN